ncbi:MAG: Hsp70 family protein [Clostridiales bacterium]|nr:Hsp70 family protein [Clostridiales bacterium]
MSDKIIGIDLGTATTEAAFFADGEVRMIENPDGRVITPSAVGMDESGNLVVGERARAQYILAPERTAIEVKRKIGTEEKIQLGKTGYTPVELSSFLLKYVKRYTSEALGEEITRAVISVPAYFDDVQRRAVIEAGTMAGFSVERIINEPTAAALSYGIDHMEEESYLLVYDLGGGTFDVTLLELFEGVLEVKASAGDNQLGGKDFDECLVRLLRSRFEEQSDISLEGNLYAAARLKEAAEGCKIALSTRDESIVRIPMLAERNGIPFGLEETVTRAQFEDLISELLERTHQPILRALDDAGIRKEELAGVLLVGGSTRIPLVSRDIEQLIGMAPSSAIDPDFSVARGAAIQAGIISGAMEEENELVVTDVCPFTLGIQVWDGMTSDCMSVILPRNTTIPVTRKERYNTSNDYQTTAKISVYQGDSRMVSRNHFLGTFDIGGIPPRKAMREQIDVYFSYNANGILNVRAQLVSTGADAGITINVMENAEDEILDVSNWKEAAYASDYRSVIRRCERFLDKAKKKAGADHTMVDELEDLLYRLKKAIILDNPEEADDLEDEILEILETEG